MSCDKAKSPASETSLRLDAVVSCERECDLGAEELGSEFWVADDEAGFLDGTGSPTFPK